MRLDKARMKHLRVRYEMEIKRGKSLHWNGLQKFDPNEVGSSNSNSIYNKNQLKEVSSYRQFAITYAIWNAGAK